MTSLYKNCRAPLLLCLFTCAAFPALSNNETGFIDVTEHRDRIARALATTHEPDSRLRVELLLKPDMDQPESIDIWLVTAETRIELDINPDGVIELGPNQSLMREALGFEVSPYSHEFGIATRIVADLPFEKSLEPQAVRDSIEQFNALIRREAGVLRFLAPRFDGVRARIGVNETVSLATARGLQRELFADESGWVEITWKLKSLDSIEFSALPQEYEFVD
jgi:hypothetical protein